MIRLTIAGLCLLLATSLTRSADDPTPAEQPKKLVASYDEIEKAYLDALKADRKPEALKEAREKFVKSMKEWTDKALASVREHPADADAIPLMEKLMGRGGKHAGEFAELLRKHQMADKRLADMAAVFYTSNDDKAKSFALEIADSHPDRTTRGRASYAIGNRAKWSLIRIEHPLGKPPAASAEEKQQLRKDADKYLTRVVKEYADVTPERGDDKLGDLAAAELIGLDNIEKIKVGKVSPDIEGTDLNGKPLRLSDHRGKVVLVVFWASWCGPCMREIPHEKELVERFKDRPFVLVGVNGDRELEKAKKAVESKEIPWRSFAPHNLGRMGGIAAAWNVYAWPSTFVLDPEGVIRATGVRGNQLDKRLEDMIEAAEKKSGG